MNASKVANLEVVVMGGIPVMHNGTPHDRKIKARALPFVAGGEWLTEAKKLQAEYLDAASDQSEADAILAIADLFVEYDPDWPSDEIKKHASGIQIIEAFEALIELNDPLAGARKRATKEQDEMLKKAEGLSRIVGEDLVQKIVSSKMSSVLPNDLGETPSSS